MKSFPESSRDGRISTKRLSFPFPEFLLEWQNPLKQNRRDDRDRWVTGLTRRDETFEFIDLFLYIYGFKFGIEIQDANLHLLGQADLLW